MKTKSIQYPSQKINNTVIPQFFLANYKERFSLHMECWIVGLSEDPFFWLISSYLFLTFLTFTILFFQVRMMLCCLKDRALCFVPNCCKVRRFWLVVPYLKALQLCDIFDWIDSNDQKRIMNWFNGVKKTEHLINKSDWLDWLARQGGDRQTERCTNSRMDNLFYSCESMTNW